MPHNKAYIQSSKLHGLVSSWASKHVHMLGGGDGTHPSSMGTGVLALGAFPDPDLCTSLSGHSFLFFFFWLYIFILYNTLSNKLVLCCAELLSVMLTLCDLMNVAHQAPLSKGFSGKNTGVGDKLVNISECFSGFCEPLQKIK